MQEPDAHPQSSCGQQEPATAVRRWIQANCTSDGVVTLCHRRSGRGLVLLARHASHRACVAARSPCSWHLPEAGQATGGPCPALEAKRPHRHPVAPRNHDSDQAHASTRRYALPEPCVFNRSAALRCDIRRACRGKRSALGPAWGIPRTRRMGAVLTDDLPVRFGALFGTYAIEPSLRRMVCRGTIQPLAATRIRPSGPE